VFFFHSKTEYLFNKYYKHKNIYNISESLQNTNMNEKKGSGGYTYYSSIGKLEFYVLGSEENYIDSTVSVVNPELFKGNLPVAGGCYDPNMGTTEYSWACSGCFNIKGVCPGHSGSIDLYYPVKSPLFRESILKWLKIVCFNCGRLMVVRDINMAKSKLLMEYVKLSKDVKHCPHADCGAYHPRVYKDKFGTSQEGGAV
jgi:DNA-directed RNA polymerase II subunit RPB1